MIEDAEHDEWVNIKLICNPKFIPTIYHCRVTKNCSYFTDNSRLIKEHSARCEEMSKQKIEGKLKPYGVNRNVVEQLVEMGYLPNEACDFRKTFFCAYDIEALEDKSVVGEMKNVEGIHRIVSISIACNDGHQKCFIRKDSSHEAAVELVEEFVSGFRRRIWRRFSVEKRKCIFSREMQWSIIQRCLFVYITMLLVKILGQKSSGGGQKHFSVHNVQHN